MSSLGSQLNRNATILPSTIDCITPVLGDETGMENDPSSFHETHCKSVGRVVCRAFILSSDWAGSNFCCVQQISTNCIVVTNWGRKSKIESPWWLLASANARSACSMFSVLLDCRRWIMASKVAAMAWTALSPFFCALWEMTLRWFTAERVSIWVPSSRDRKTLRKRNAYAEAVCRYLFAI